jgi:hypothetical protein
MVFGANTHRPVLGLILAELEFVVLSNLVRSVDLKIAIPEINLKFLPGFFKNLERFRFALLMILRLSKFWAYSKFA